MDALRDERQVVDFLGSHAKLALRGAFGILLLTLGLAGANLAGLGGPGTGGWIRGPGTSSVYVVAAGVVMLRAVRVPHRRAAWALLGIGLSLSAAGNVVWAVAYDNAADPAIPSVCDVLWLALYPASYAGLVLLDRAKNGTVQAGVWLDGVVAGLGISALGAAVVIEPVLHSATGSWSAIATNLAYPIADLLLAALVIGLWALRGWGMDRAWATLGAGFLLLCVADSLYLLRVAGGSEQTGALPNLFFMAAVVLLASAAWLQPCKLAPARLESRSMWLIPAGFVVASIGLMLYDHFVRLHFLVIALAIATLLAATLRMALTFRDVRALAVTRREAMTDELTSLPNRRGFMRTLETAIAAAGASGEPLALLVVDLDAFKELNDALGHHAGDSLLRQIGPRIGAVLRRNDTLGRLGGDEFAVLLSAPCEERDAVAIADRLREAVSIPFDVEGVSLQVSASVGIAQCAAHSTDAGQLLRQADVAMYQAKGARSGRELYLREHDDNSRESFRLAADLSDAIAGGQLEVHFQPKADSVEGRIVGLEALVRWRHPSRGLLPPAAFVGVAEHAGLMRDLTRTVLDGALGECRRWRDAGRDLYVAVNVSFTDLLDALFPDEIAAALALHGLDAEALTIEVTERSIMSDAERVGAVLARLDSLGVRISLDDFGTGYSSLTHLATMPVSEVKIDRSFVSRMRIEATSRAIVHSTIQLAHNLGIRVAAEGVEDEQTWAALRDLDCDLVQGYHLSPPMPAADVEAFLARHLVRSTAATGGPRLPAPRRTNLPRPRGRAA